MFIDLAGHHFFTVDLGAGPRTFLAHGGWIGTNEDWLPTLAALSKTWRAVSYDHRGAGETVVPLEEITAAALVDDIFRVMDALAIERCVLAGFSSGTAFTLRAALRHPERFEGLVFMNGTGGVQAPNAGPARPLPLPSRWPGADHLARMRWFIERCTPEPGVDHFRRWGEHMLLRAEPAAADRLFAIIPPTDPALLEALASITLPTLIVHGAQDAFASTAAMEHLAAQIPRSKLVVLNDSGHLPAMIRPLEVAGIINDFFAS